MIHILKVFIKAERTGNRLLHLSVHAMLPSLATAGHNFYTKSAYLYLQMMNKLEETHPDVYQSFIKGHHVVHQSNRFWVGLSSDLAIEQILMSEKSTGGLARGRGARGKGISKSQRATWLLSMPACAEFNNAMQEVTDTLQVVSDQYKELDPARAAKASQDMIAITSFLQKRNPFSSGDISLRNIVSDVVADSRVKVDNAKQVGFQI